MAIIPESDNSTRKKINAYHEEKNLKQKPRPHLGFSLLGHPCDRWLWLSFRWAVREQFPGRILRLFRRGSKEEETAASDLREIGVDLRETGQYQRIIFTGKHVHGSPDGIIHSGVPEAPKKKHIWECKTHSKKSFDDLVKNGVKESKYQHFVQMQCAMYKTGIDRALYSPVCKDDDRINPERVKLDPAIGEKYIARGHRITMKERLPVPLSTDPAWYQCKYCAAHDFCFGDAGTTEVNCRTCAHSTPKEDDTWFCERWNATIPDDVQYTGCRSHAFHPDLVKWELDQERSTQWSAAYIVNGGSVLNGEDGYSSGEILAGGSFHDETVDMVRKTFSGEIVK